MPRRLQFRHRICDHEITVIAGLVVLFVSTVSTMVCAADTSVLSRLGAYRFLVVLYGYHGRIDRVIGRFGNDKDAQLAKETWIRRHPKESDACGIKAPDRCSLLGALSARYEVGSGGPRTISSGKMKQMNRATGKVVSLDDPGGKSYGSYQLASRRGIHGSSVASFVRTLYPLEFGRLDPGTPAFDRKWLAVVDRDVEAFKENEHSFICETHFGPVAMALKAKIGLDVGKRSQALRDVLWSTAVQHGPPEDKLGRAIPLLIKALEPLKQRGKEWSTVGDDKVINAIYVERGRKGPNGNLVHFPAFEKLERFEHERRDALIELENERNMER
jgi:hypothetical protein